MIEERKIKINATTQTVTNSLHSSQLTHSNSFHLHISSSNPPPPSKYTPQASRGPAKLRSSRSFSTYPAYILNAPVTEVSKCSNGVRVASETAHGETATVGVWIDAGSRWVTVTWHLKVWKLITLNRLMKEKKHVWLYTQPYWHIEYSYKCIYINIQTLLLTDTKPPRTMAPPTSSSTWPSRAPSLALKSKWK